MKGLFLSQADASVDSVSLDATRGCVALTGRDCVRVIRLPDQGSMSQIVYHTGGNQGCVWSPHSSVSSRLAVATGQTIAIWNVSDEAYEEANQLKQHAAPVRGMAFSPFDPDILASCSDGNQHAVRLWDLRMDSAASSVGEFYSWRGSASHVAFNRGDSNKFLSTHGDVIRVWDTRVGGTSLYSVAPHSSPITGVDWSYSSANKIVSCAKDGDLCVCGLRDGYIAKYRRTQAGRIFTVRWMPDLELIACGTASGLHLMQEADNNVSVMKIIGMESIPWMYRNPVGYEPEKGQADAVWHLDLKLFQRFGEDSMYIRIVECAPRYDASILAVWDEELNDLKVLQPSGDEDEKILGEKEDDGVEFDNLNIEEEIALEMEKVKECRVVKMEDVEEEGGRVVVIEVKCGSWSSYVRLILSSSHLPRFEIIRTEPELSSAKLKHLVEMLNNNSSAKFVSHQPFLSSSLNILIDEMKSIPVFVESPKKEPSSPLKKLPPSSSENVLVSPERSRQLRERRKRQHLQRRNCSGVFSPSGLFVYFRGVKRTGVSSRRTLRLDIDMAESTPDADKKAISYYTSAFSRREEVRGQHGRVREEEQPKAPPLRVSYGWYVDRWVRRARKLASEYRFAVDEGEDTSVFEFNANVAEKYHRHKVKIMWELLGSALHGMCLAGTQNLLPVEHPLSMDFLDKLVNRSLKRHDFQTAAMLFCVATLYGVNRSTEKARYAVETYCDFLRLWQLPKVRGQVDAYREKWIVNGVSCASRLHTLSLKKDLRRPFSCSICCTPANGLVAVCLRCFHGGHLNHMKEWFDRKKKGSRVLCPVPGCGCGCEDYFRNFPSSRKARTEVLPVQPELARAESVYLDTVEVPWRSTHVNPNPTVGSVLSPISLSIARDLDNFSPST